MIYVIGGIKGGSGKSTISTNLTILLAAQYGDVLLIDADDQCTASDFTFFRSETMKGNIDYTSIQLSDKSVRDQTLKLKAKYEHVVIDTGGRDTASQRAAISIADIYLVDPEVLFIRLIISFNMCVFYTKNNKVFTYFSSKPCKLKIKLKKMLKINLDCFNKHNSDL